MKSRPVSLILLALLCCSTAAATQSSSADEALRRAVQNEQMLKAAEAEYSYRQDLLVQTFGEANSLSAQLHRVSEITYDDLGNRVEKIVEFPPSRLTMLLGIQKPDFKSLLGVDPFFLTPDALPRYSVRFIQKQKIDEVTAYQFEVDPVRGKSAPKRRSPDDFPFKGRIWVDDQDFQIVKVEGKALTAKEDNQRFPKFECYREYVSSKLWLPSYVLADDTLDFPRYDLPIRIKIRYTDYRRVQKRR